MYIHYGHGIVVENCRHIFRRELVSGIADEETRLSDGTITHNNTSARRIR
jgi:glycerol-3-phosphate cytidylyltransferase-like family protein